MRIAVDDSLCRGHGICIAVCPEVFALTDDGYAQAKHEVVPEGLGDAAQEALQACPEHAITGTDE